MGKNELEDLLYKEHILTVNVACSVHQEFKKISFGNQNPQDLVRLGPGVVSEPEDTEVCVVFDVVEFVNAVPFMPSENRIETDSERLTLWERNSAGRSKEQSCEHQACDSIHVCDHHFQALILLQLQIPRGVLGMLIRAATLIKLQSRRTRDNLNPSRRSSTRNEG